MLATSGISWKTDDSMTTCCGDRMRFARKSSFLRVRNMFVLLREKSDIKQAGGYLKELRAIFSMSYRPRTLVEGSTAQWTITMDGKSHMVSEIFRWVCSPGSCILQNFLSQYFFPRNANPVVSNSTS